MPRYRITTEHSAFNVWEIDAVDEEMAREGVFEYEEGALVDSYARTWTRQITSIEEIK
jgi:hypothetical protein